MIPATTLGDIINITEFQSADVVSSSTGSTLQDWENTFSNIENYINNNQNTIYNNFRLQFKAINTGGCGVESDNLFELNVETQPTIFNSFQAAYTLPSYPNAKCCENNTIGIFIEEYENLSELFDNGININGNIVPPYPIWEPPAQGEPPTLSAPSGYYTEGNRWAFWNNPAQDGNGFWGPLNICSGQDVSCL